MMGHTVNFSPIGEFRTKMVSTISLRVCAFVSFFVASVNPPLLSRAAFAERLSCGGA